MEERRVMGWQCEHLCQRHSLPAPSCPSLVPHLKPSFLLCLASIFAKFSEVPVWLP